jgi:hypothetical protein
MEKYDVCMRIVCPKCGGVSTVNMTLDQCSEWMRSSKTRRDVQEIFPEKTPYEREHLITGWCRVCAVDVIGKKHVSIAMKTRQVSLTYFNFSESIRYSALAKNPRRNERMVDIKDQDSEVYGLMRCQRCGKIIEVKMTANQLSEWQSSNLSRVSIEEIFPDWTFKDREMLITSLCEKCQNELDDAYGL